MLRDGLSRYGKRFSLVALILVAAGLTTWVSAQQRSSRPSPARNAFPTTQSVHSGAKDFGWEIDKDGKLCYIVQLSDEKVRQMQSSGWEFPSDIPAELKGPLDQVVVRIGSSELPRKPPLSQLAGTSRRDRRVIGSNSPLAFPAFPPTSIEAEDAAKTVEGLKSPDGKLDAEAVKELHQTLSKAFDERHASQKSELAKMAKRVEDLKKELETREASKKEIIEMRIKEICDEYHPMSWDYELDFSESVNIDSAVAPSSSDNLPAYETN